MSHASMHNSMAALTTAMSGTKPPKYNAVRICQKGTENADKAHLQWHSVNVNGVRIPDVIKDVAKGCSVDPAFMAKYTKAYSDIQYFSIPSHFNFWGFKYHFISNIGLKL
jgi:hypothetical protein